MSRCAHEKTFWGFWTKVEIFGQEMGIFVKKLISTKNRSLVMKLTDKKNEKYNPESKVFLLTKIFEKFKFLYSWPIAFDKTFNFCPKLRETKRRFVTNEKKTFARKTAILCPKISCRKVPVEKKK